jgi:hypothetical protein
MNKITWDFVGFWVSFVCGIHCVIMPFALGLTPFTNFGLMLNEYFELIVIISSVMIASYAVFSGYNKHKSFQPIVLMVLGFLIIFSTKLIIEDQFEMIMMPIGALFIALAHLRNHKLIH